MKPLRVFLALLFLFLLLTGLLWAIVIPYNEAPDEYSHFDVANFIAQKRRFPIFGKDENMGVSKYEIPNVVVKYNASYAAMPPGAYLWQALFLSLGQLFPSAYLLARLANILLLVPLAVISFSLSKKIFKQDWQKVSFVLLSLLSPQIIFTFSYVNSDAMLLVWTFLLWWWLVSFLKKETITLWKSLIFGVSLGLAVLTRYNILPLVIIAVGGFIWRLWQERRLIKFKRSLFLVMTAGIAAILTSGWWYLRNILLYHDLLVSNQFWQTYYFIYPRGQNATLWQILSGRDWWWRNWQSLWGVFGWNTIFLPNYFYRVILLMALLSLIVIYIYWRKLGVLGQKLIKLSLGIGLLVLVFSAWQSAAFAYQPQGRYLFPAWPGLVILLSLGWLVAGEAKSVLWPKIGIGVFIFFLFSWQILSLLTILVPSYY